MLSISQTGALTCGSNPGVLLTCTGASQPAKYQLVGTNNAKVTISSPGFNLTGPGTLAFTPNCAEPLARSRRERFRSADDHGVDLRDRRIRSLSR